jgi:hypothetical protein
MIASRVPAQSPQLEPSNWDRWIPEGIPQFIPYAFDTRADAGAIPAVLVAVGKVPGVVVVDAVVDPVAVPVPVATAEVLVGGVVVDMVGMVSVAEEQSATDGFMNKDWRVCPLLPVKL